MLEIELVNSLIEYLKKHNIKYATEIRMGIGVPDVSLNLGVRKNINLFDDFFLISICEYLTTNKNVNVSEIEKHFPIDKTKILNYISTLCKLKYIRIKDNEIFLVRKIFPNNLGTVISIEVKLRDWKNGLIQAQRYLSFSDFSYLLLPIEKIKNVKEEELINCGVGLLSIDANGKIKEQIQPRKSQLCDYKQKYIVTSAIVKKSHDISHVRDNIFKTLI